jgi:Family of unknown function (DUF5995)
MPPNSISDVIEQLDEIVKKSTQKNDRAGYFAALYKRVTVAVSEKIKEGYFDDNAGMEKLDIVFANRYLLAYEQYYNGKTCTGSWQLAFDTTRLWKPMVLHHLIAGMNAHISLDLGIAAATVAPGQKITDIHKDFNKINTILASLVDEVKNELYSMWPLSKLLAKLNIGKLENQVAGFSMNIARDAAWQVAIDYASLNTPEQKEIYVAERDASVKAFGNKLLFPGFLMRNIMGLFRIFEFGSIAAKIKKMNGV